MVVLANTWQTYFAQDPKNNESNAYLENFRSCTEVGQDPNTFHGKIINTLREETDTIIMAKSIYNDNMKLFHSIKDLGGTRTRPTNKIIGMEGFGPQATPVAFNMDTIADTVSTEVPSTDALMAIDRADRVTLATEQQGNVFSNANFVVLPPFLSIPYLQMNTRNPAELLVATVSLITEFDNANAHLPQNKKAHTQAINVLAFLWCAVKNHLDPLEFHSDRDDLEVEVWGKVRHATCILQNPQIPTTPTVPGGLPPVISPAIQELASNVKEQATILEKMRQNKSDERDEKKNKFDKLHDSTKNLILQASSTDGELTPSQPVETCQNFFEKSTIAKAMDYLKIVMKDKFNCSVDIKTGLVTALYTGHFTRERDDAPCNLSFFSVPKLKPLSAGFQEQTTFLQIKATQGTGWDSPDIKEAIKQGIVTPSNIHEFEHQTKNLWGITSFFFGQHSRLPQKLVNFMELTHKHSVCLEAYHENDPQFFTRLGYRIDNHIYRWMESCARAQEREEVNDRLIALEGAIDELLLSTFHQLLPVTFASVSTKKDEEEKNDNRRKRRKLEKEKKEKENAGKGKPVKVENTGTIEDWLCKNDEEFSENFAGKNTDAKPKGSTQRVTALTTVKI